MAISAHHSNNFGTMVKAAKDGHLALMECHDALTGQVRYAICMVSGPDESDEMTFTPVGHLYDGEPFDPYTAYIPAGDQSEDAAKVVAEEFARHAQVVIELAEGNVIDPETPREEDILSEQNEALATMRTLLRSHGVEIE